MRGATGKARRLAVAATAALCLCLATVALAPCAAHAGEVGTTEVTACVVEADPAAPDAPDGGALSDTGDDRRTALAVLALAVAGSSGALMLALARRRRIAARKHGA